VSSLYSQQFILFVTHLFVFADFLLISFVTVICDDIDRRMDTVYWPRAEVVAGESSFNSSNSTKQERMQPPEYTTNEKKRKSARFVTDKLPDVADMHVESLLDETNSDIGTGLFTNNHCNHTKQAPSPPEKKRKFTNAVKSIQSDFAKINVGEGMQHRRDEHVITMLSPMNHSDDTNQVTTQLHASTSNEMMSKYKAQSNMPLDVAEIDVDERLLDMRNADIVTGVSSTNNSNNVMQGTMHERKGKPRTDCSREQWLHADDDIAMSGFNDRSTPDAAKISVSLPQDQRQEFTQSPASATNEEMIKYTAESNNSVQTLPLDVAEINVDEGLLEKPKADVVTGVFPNNLSNNTIQGTMQPPTSATNEKKIKNTSESNNSVQLLPLDVAEIDAGLFEKPKEDVVTGLSPNNLSNDAMQGTMQPPSFAPNEKKRKRQTDCCRASKSLNDKHLDGSEINHVNNTAKQGTSRLPASAKNAKRRKNQQVNEEVNVFILSPDNIRKPLPTVQNVIIQHPSIPHPRNFILCFPSCTLSYTVPSYYDCLGYWGQKRREKAVLRTQQHYLDMYLKGLGICSSAKTRQHQTGSSNLPQRLSNAAKINVDTKERGDDEEEEPLINASSGAKITESVRPLPHPHHQQQQQQQQQQQKPNNENDDTNLLVSPYPRLGVDVILSLKDPVYTSIMYEFCQVMGERTNTEDKNIDTREMANKALLRFKNMNNIGGPHDEGSATMAATTLSSVRFFKRVKKGVYVEVDEIEALKSEFLLFPYHSSNTVFHRQFHIVCC
jgi:hypothetical protein